MMFLQPFMTDDNTDGPSCYQQVDCASGENSSDGQNGYPGRKKKKYFWFFINPGFRGANVKMFYFRSIGCRLIFFVFRRAKRVRVKGSVPYYSGRNRNSFKNLTLHRVHDKENNRPRRYCR